MTVKTAYADKVAAAIVAHELGHLQQALHRQQEALFKAKGVPADVLRLAAQELLLFEGKLIAEMLRQQEQVKGV